MKANPTKIKERVKLIRVPSSTQRKIRRYAWKLTMDAEIGYRVRRHPETHKEQARQIKIALIEAFQTGIEIGIGRAGRQFRRSAINQLKRIGLNIETKRVLDNNKRA